MTILYVQEHAKKKLNSIIWENRHLTDVPYIET